MYQRRRAACPGGPAVRVSASGVPCVPCTVWCTPGAHVAIVLFHGEKCRSCRAFTPKYARLAQQYQGQAEFFRVVATRNADLLASEHVATLLPWCAVSWLQLYTHLLPRRCPPPYNRLRRVCACADSLMMHVHLHPSFHLLMLLLPWCATSQPASHPNQPATPTRPPPRPTRTASLLHPPAPSPRCTVCLTAGRGETGPTPSLVLAPAPPAHAAPAPRNPHPAPCTCAPFRRTWMPSGSVRSSTSSATRCSSLLKLPPYGCLSVPPRPPGADSPGSWRRYAHAPGTSC